MRSLWLQPQNVWVRHSTAMVKIPIRGTMALLAATAIQSLWCGFQPIGSSLRIGVVVALILYLRHRLRPVQEEDIENKRPLGQRRLPISDFKLHT